MDVSESALLEWVESLEACNGHQVQSLEDLRDGELLLYTLHDISPYVFPAPSPGGKHLLPLLEGLQEHFRHRPGRGVQCAQLLLEQEAAGPGRLKISLLVQLVIWATLDNDLPGAQRQRYMDTCEQLSNSSKQAIMAILQHFGGAEASQPRSVVGTPPAGKLPLCRESSTGGPAPAADALPDFMEVGLDDETRYRRLKKCYHAVMEEQERLEDERNCLRRQLEAEGKMRRDAEEGERMARAELRESDEARHRLKEESRALFELRLEQEVQGFREQLKQRDKLIEATREEYDLARAQAGKAEKLAEQLGLCKKKLEESQVWKREKEALQNQVNELISSKNSGSGAPDHLHSMLNRAREEAKILLEERDEAHRQTHQLQEELSQLQDEHQATTEELAHLQQGLASQQEDSSKRRVDASPASEAGGPGASRSPRFTNATRSPNEASVEEVRQLLHTQKDDLLERLLVEKERATRAETTMQLKLAEVASLKDQRSRDAQTIEALEETSRNQASRLKELQDQGSSSDDSAKVRELQALLAQRERELNIHRWRTQTESDSLVAQETLMVSCFHELGLKYHKLLVQKDTLQRRLHEYERAGDLDSGASPARHETASPSAG